MRIGIELNGVLRNTIGKFEQTYQKFLMEKTQGIEENDEFVYEMNLPVISQDLTKHFKFKDSDEFYSFLYEEFPMEIFGHAQSTEYTSFNDLNDFYFNNRDKHDLSIVSDEIGKSKPASLFFLSKFGCQFEKVKFYSNSTINSMWNEIDVLLTANPDLLLSHPDDKLLIKFETEYNKNVDCHYKISSIKELESIINNFVLC